MNQRNILVVDDEPDIRNSVQEILIDEGYQVRVAENTAIARQHANSLPPDLVLLDIWMPGEDGISLLKDWQRSGGINCPVVMMSGHGTIETAVEATRLGAYDLIEKPLTMAKLLMSVKRALEAANGVHDNGAANLSAEKPVGGSMQMRTLREQAKKLARHDNVLLITGAPGVGKQTFANYVHSLSPHNDKQFIVLSEDSFNDSEVAKRLFGSEARGVSTPGVLELHKGGTIFISDVAHINMPGQKILSRLLRRKQFSRIGGSASQKLEVRIMAASQRNLREAVTANRFDDELYFQLNVIPIRIPALREHVQDVPELLRYYIDFYCAQKNYPHRNFTIAAQNHLLHYPWPGNIRELGNLVQRLLVLGTSYEISAAEVELALDENSFENQSEAAWHEKLCKLPLRAARESFERGYFLHQLKQVNGNISKLSARVGMERTHLYRKLRALKINAKDF